MSSASGGSIVWNLDINSAKFDSKLAAARSSVNNLSDDTSKGGQRIKGAFTAIGKSSLIAAASIGGLVAVFRPFINDAVTRVDILNNFPKVMANMGIAADDASKATNKITAGLQGLPTALDTATLAVQRLTTKTGDVSESTDIFLALNNAILAGGAPMQLQASATEQFAQAFAKGKPDMMEWRSMVAAMPAQLDQVAKSMGMASADQLGESLRDGSVSMEQFSDELVKLNSKGVGGLPNLAEQAKNATGGIATGMANARIAITRGIVKIMQSIGTSKIADTISSIGSKIESVFGFIAKHLDVVAVGVGVVLATAFAVLAAKVIIATWPILAVAAAFTGLYLVYKKFKPQIDIIIGVFMQLWNITKPIRDFIANQFTAAWNDLRASFDSMKKSLQPFMPQLKILGVLLGVVVLAPLLIVIATVGVLIAVFVAVITVAARLIGWFSKLQAKFWEMAGRMQSAINSRLQPIVDWFKSLGRRIMNAMGSAGMMLYNFGREIINGLIRGIRDMGGRLKSIVSDTAKDVMNQFKGILGIQSPSKVFAGFGRDIGAGLVEGLNASRGIVDSAVEGLSGATISPVVSSSPQDTETVGTKTVVQNNNIYNQLDMNLVLRDLAWQLGN